MSEKTKKPRCKLVGTDGNVFALIERASAALKQAGMEEELKKMIKRVTTQATSYQEALSIICKYVEAY